MFTQSMPALINALRQVLPPQAIAPITQALGNCGQPLTHRGGVNFAPPMPRNNNGVFSGRQWDPGRHQSLFPDSSSHSAVDVGGMNVNWNSGNRYDSQFFFPTSQYFQQNQFYGGPTVNTQYANIEYITNQTLEGDTVRVENLTTTVINGDKVPGLPGPAGAPGRNGRDGAPGAPGGVFNAVPQGQFRDLFHLRGIAPRVVAGVPELVPRPHSYVNDARVRALSSVSVPTNAISGASVSVSLAGGSAVIPTGVTFNPDTCSVTFSGTTTVYFATTASPTVSVSTTAASAVTVQALDPANKATALMSDNPTPEGILVELIHTNTANVGVCKTPELRGVVPGVARVFQP